MAPSATGTATAADSYRSPPTPFDPTTDAVSLSNPTIRQLRDAAPHLKLYTRDSPEFQTLRSCYNSLIDAQPLVICRPTSAADISAVVRVASSNGAPLTVRCGGHDAFGRSCVDGAVVVDLREMDSMRLCHDDDDGDLVVKVGGGVLAHNLVAFLQSKGLCTAHGSAGSVGWTSWAMGGGYGLFAEYAGFGVDNIISARLVTADGAVVDTRDDAELLWGVRGAGASFGVVFETTVRVHPLQPEILAGFLAYDWREAESVLAGFQALADSNRIPECFGGQMGFAKGEWGVGLALLFVWPGADKAQGKKFLDVVRALGTVVADTVGDSKSILSIHSDPHTHPPSP
jgi:FAD/FMN-containing dehydrogenase